MAVSHELSLLTVSGGLGEGPLSSHSSGSGLTTTDSILNYLHRGADLRETFQTLMSQLMRTSHDLAPQDYVLWKKDRKTLARLVWNHAVDRHQMRHDTSYEAKEVDGKKMVYIGCKTKDAEKEVKRNLKGSGAMDFVLKTLHFDEVQVNNKFTGHLARTDLSSTLVREPPSLIKRSLLGIPFEAPSSEGTSSSTTLGGIILVDGQPYALATGCPFSDERAKAMAMNQGEVVVYSYSGRNQPQEPHVARELMRERREYPHFSILSDWALVALPDGELPPNTILDVEQNSSQDWPWPSTPMHLKLLAERYITEKDLAHLMQKEGGRVACLTYSPSSSSSAPIPGFISPGTSTVMLSGTVFTVLRIDMFTSLGNAVCGIIIAGSRKGDDYISTPRNPSSDLEVFSAFMIPIMDVLKNISETLQVDVFLPTLTDYRIHSLQNQCQDNRWESDKPPFPYLNMELLLGQQKQNRRGLQSNEELKLRFRISKTQTVSSPPPNFGWPTRYILEEFIGLHYETTLLLLQLGDICPLSAAFRPGLRQWVRDYRKSRWRNRRTFACTAIIEQCLQTEAGENILGFLIFLWKTQRQQTHKGYKRGTAYEKRRIAWLAQLLSSLFDIMKISKTATPSIQQLQAFVYCLISAFKDKDLKHLYLVLDANYDVKRAGPANRSWATTPPTRLNSIYRFWRSVKGCMSGESEKADLVDVDTALYNTPDVLTTWNCSVATTTRILVLLHKIYASDRRQMMVYCGEGSTWVRFYAAVVLGLDVQFRRLERDGAHPMRRMFHHSAHLSNDSPADVVVYFDGQPGTTNVCEIVDRVDVGQAATGEIAPAGYLDEEGN
ncbi:hypothetical protein FSARC_10766 [Fusarium sarcochroum]|uniref:Uncharacterized protein n=1 Tax=Fusarium sarcochroum TaxID=1208366 RepID=A0A8H4TJV3_9HYPO|nr:hypothetical protein FSARC_10766 [Fusarium sarcochroum]